MRSASLLTWLARHYDVDLITFREPRAADPANHVPSKLVRRLHVIDLPAHARHVLARAAQLRRLARGVPPLMDRFAGFGQNITAATRGERYEIAMIEHFWCAPYVEEVSSVSDTTVLDLHNIESVLHGRSAESDAQTMSRWPHRAFQNFCRKLEEKWLPRYSCLLTTIPE